ncbi:MAG: DUF4177 domain-containing protein [Prevotella sp.]|nr:DUF4177 domain-containing protein [Prevotella sp.]
MKKYLFVLMLALCSASSFAQTQSNSDSTYVATEQWEYKSIFIRNTHTFAKQGEITYENPDKTLNKYGKQGWELVAVVPLIASNLSSGNAYTNCLCYTFKRKKIVSK